MLHPLLEATIGERLDGDMGLRFGTSFVMLLVRSFAGVPPSPYPPRKIL
jgi:hypothetical protein